MQVVADFCEVSAPELKPCLEPVEQCELLIYNGENVFSTHANRILVFFNISIRVFKSSVLIM